MVNQFGLSSTTRVYAGVSLLDTKFVANNARSGGVVAFSDCLEIAGCTFASAEPDQFNVTATNSEVDLMFSPQGELVYFAGDGDAGAAAADGALDCAACEPAQSLPLPELQEEPFCAGIVSLADPWIEAVRQVRRPRPCAAHARVWLAAQVLPRYARSLSCCSANSALGHQALHRLSTHSACSAATL